MSKDLGERRFHSFNVTSKAHRIEAVKFDDGHIILMAGRELALSKRESQREAQVSGIELFVRVQAPICNMSQS